ncbi:MAG: hypothetical protein AABY22_18460, partial [Nanoarchaeota archaeon]
QNPHLVEATRMQLRVIELENLTGLLREKQAKETECRLALEKSFNIFLKSQAERIDILEEARSVQRSLNEKLLKIQSQPDLPKKWFWQK